MTASFPDHLRTDGVADRYCFPCDGCGALIEFRRGLHLVDCERCGHANKLFDVPTSALDLTRSLPSPAEPVYVPEMLVRIGCESCGASFSVDDGSRSGECPFCGSGVMVVGGRGEQLRPQAMLPPSEEPTDLKSIVAKSLARQIGGNDRPEIEIRRPPRLIFLPFWVFAIRAKINFAGVRSYKLNLDDFQRAAGKLAVEERKLIVPASRSFDPARLAALGPWDLSGLVPYESAALSGSVVEHAVTPIQTAFADAVGQLFPVVIKKVEAKLGGASRQIVRLCATNATSTGRLVLLPVWVGVYMWNDRSCRFLANAQTGVAVTMEPAASEPANPKEYIRSKKKKLFPQMMKDAERIGPGGKIAYGILAVCVLAFYYYIFRDILAWPNLSWLWGG